MNCPSCGNRNPTSAKRCLHCNMLFVEEREGLLESATSDDVDANKLFVIIGAVFAVIIGGSMFLFGFDTYESKCVAIVTASTSFEKDPAWERDRSAEEREYQRKSRLHRDRTGRPLPRDAVNGLRCYRRKTGHVDGAVQ